MTLPSLPDLSKVWLLWYVRTDNDKADAAVTVNGVVTPLHEEPTREDRE